MKKGLIVLIALCVAFSVSMHGGKRYTEVDLTIRGINRLIFVDENGKLGYYDLPVGKDWDDFFDFGKADAFSYPKGIPLPPFIELTPEDVKAYHASLQQMQKAQQKSQMLKNTPMMLWHNGKWVSTTYIGGRHEQWGLNNDNKQFVTWGESFIPLVIGNSGNNVTVDQFVTSREKRISDAIKKLWHNGAWHDALWNDNAMKSYIDGDNIITLTPAELAASDAKRKLWHNGAWHERAWENNMQGYFQDDKFITMTPEEITASDNMLKTK